MIEILYHDFYKEGMIVIGFKYNGIEDMLTIDASNKTFDKFAPDGEYDLKDESGEYTALFDKWGNLHWLVTNGDYVLYRAVNCNNLIENLIHEKWNQ